MSRIGYARVSTADQHPEAQESALRAAGCDRVYTDHGVSGTLARRPQLDAALGYLRPGDALVITKLDRLGRSVKNLIDQVNDLRERGVDFVVLDQGIDTTTPAGKMMFHVLAAIAEFERDLIAERTRDGLAVARANNVHLGRPFKLNARQAEMARASVAAGQKPGEVAQALGCSERTVYRVLAAVS